jgi:hypothetical protein
MTTTVSRDRKPDPSESEERPTLGRDRVDTTRHELDTRSFDPTQGRKIGSDPYDGPPGTEGRLRPLRRSHSSPLRLLCKPVVNILAQPLDPDPERLVGLASPAPITTRSASSRAASSSSIPSARDTSRLQGRATSGHPAGVAGPTGLHGGADLGGLVLRAWLCAAECPGSGQERRGMGEATMGR